MVEWIITAAGSANAVIDARRARNANVSIRFAMTLVLLL
jgi:hypothetical protein